MCKLCKSAEVPSLYLSKKDLLGLLSEELKLPAEARESCNPCWNSENTSNTRHKYIPELLAEEWHSYHRISHKYFGFATIHWSILWFLPCGLSSTLSCNNILQDLSDNRTWCFVVIHRCSFTCKWSIEKKELQNLEIKTRLWSLHWDIVAIWGWWLRYY